MSSDTVRERVKLALESIDETEKPRRKLQKLFHRTFMQHKPAMVFFTPRRSYKSTSVAMWCAALLASEEGHSCRVYCTGRRSARNMLFNVANFIKLMQPTTGGRVTQRNEAESIVFQTANGHENSLQVYCADLQTLRGTGCKNKCGTVIIDEPCFMEKTVFDSIVRPAITNPHVNLILMGWKIENQFVISSRVDELNEEVGKSRAEKCATYNLEECCSSCAENNRNPSECEWLADF